MMLIKNAKEALQMVSNNEAIVNEVRQENQTLQEKIKSDITEETKDTVKKYMAKESLKTYKIDQRQELDLYKHKRRKRVNLGRLLYFALPFDFL